MMSNNQKPQRPATPAGARPVKKLQAGKKAAPSRKQPPRQDPGQGMAHALRSRLEGAAAAHGVEISVPGTIVDDMATPEGRARVAKGPGADAAAQLARKYGVNTDAAKVVETAQSLATEDGRLAAMKELGVHMSGRLAIQKNQVANEPPDFI